MIAFLLTVALLLSGCGRVEEPLAELMELFDGTAATEETEETVPVTIPPDGNPSDVTCKGSYTGNEGENQTVAMSGVVELTNEQLQVWYWAEVAQFRQENHGQQPDFDRPLDVQTCEIDSSVNSWQQYFLKQALSTWHSAQALVQHSREVPLMLEEAYQPNRINTEKYMTGMPAAEVLYGYDSHYSPNSMHQAYLTGLPRLLEELAVQKGYADVNAMAQEAFGASVKALEAYADSSNLGYMYFTHLSHSVEPTAEELESFYGDNGADSTIVDFRHILLIPGEKVFPSKKDQTEPAEVTVAADGTVTCGEEVWTACEADAEKLLKEWRKKHRGTEATFGELARKYSKDSGTMVNGGLYRDIRKGQMMKALDDWCFDPARQIGDTTFFRSDYGVHILYFSGRRSAAQEEAERAYFLQNYSRLISEAKEMFPMEVSYKDMSLREAQAVVSVGDILYPDIAHEMFPEVPLYLQQDYPKTMYGGFPIRTNGCGITSFAMVASYLADKELTPPEMCALYGRYSHSNGTDGMIFNNESSVLGFYLREKTYDTRVARKALEDGHLVVSIQHPGYWTRGGHYIVCERITVDGMVQVRDSNIYNYMRVPAHKQDLHKWGNITRDGSGYWVFEHKITRIPACSRCGNPEGIIDSLLNLEYICEKCDTALLRRNTYLDT